MTSYLLDTHVVLWLAVEPERLPPHVRTALENADRLLVSAASAYELAQKVRLGKLPAAAGILAQWTQLISAMQAEELPLSVAHMMRAGAMTWTHRDPFDRMLAAQAQLSGLVLVTKDEALLTFAEVSCLNWS